MIKEDAVIDLADPTFAGRIYGQVKLDVTRALLKNKVLRGKTAAVAAEHLETLNNGCTKALRQAIMEPSFRGYKIPALTPAP